MLVDESTRKRTCYYRTRTRKGEQHKKREKRKRRSEGETERTAATRDKTWQSNVNDTFHRVRVCVESFKTPSHLPANPISPTLPSPFHPPPLIHTHTNTNCTQLTLCFLLFCFVFSKRSRHPRSLAWTSWPRRACPSSSPPCSAMDPSCS